MASGETSNERLDSDLCTDESAVAEIVDHKEVKNGSEATENQSLMEQDPVTTERAEIDDAEQMPMTSGLPVDRGWAWMILVGATIEMIVVVGMLKSSGIFFVAFQERFNSSSSMTSLISTVENGVWSVSALIVMTVGMKFLSCRAIHMIGALALCLSYVISSRAEDVRVLLLSHGIIQGFGMACMDPVSITMLGCYFDKRRGLANSIANSGGSFGGLVFAPLLTKMFEYYGYSGAMLICGAFFLHAFLSGALFRPQTFYIKQQKQTAAARRIKQHSESAQLQNGTRFVAENGSVFKQEDFVRQQTFISETSSITVSIDRKRLAVNEIRSRVDSDNVNEALLNSQDQYLPTSINTKRRQRTYTDPEDSKIVDPISRIKLLQYTSSEYIAGSQFDILAAMKIDVNSDEKTKDCKSYCITFSNLFDFSLFRNPVFIIFLLGAGILCTPHALCMVYIAPHAKDMGLSSADVAKLITIYSAIDMGSRIIIGIIADRKWVRRSTIIGVTSCTVGIMSHLMIFYTSYNWFLFYSIVFGLIGGAYFTLFAVVIIDYLTLEKLHSCLGFTILLQAIIVSSSFAVLGSLRDSTGSYIASFHLLGALAFIGGSLMAFLPLVEKCYGKKQSKN